MNRRWLAGILRKPGFWFIMVLIVLITVPHYEDALSLPSFISSVIGVLGVTRHAFERILYLAPIVWAGFMFGWRGAFITSLVALACMLPRIIILSDYPQDSLFETAAVFIIGNVLAVSSEALRRERGYRTKLEMAQQDLRSYISIIKENERRLRALNRIASTVSRSLELREVLAGAIDSVIEVIEADNALMFLLDRRSNELVLAAHRGASVDFVRGVDRLKVGEGLNGQVAASGEPLSIEDVSRDPRLTREVVSRDGIRSALIVPLNSKGSVNGTLCVNMLRLRKFAPEEIELLVAIGNQIGVAVENANLYQQQQHVAEELRASEERYRTLFENAHDAIWLQDLAGKVLAVNKACEALTGYGREDLQGMNVISFLPDESLELSRRVRNTLLRGGSVEQPYEQRLTRRDGREAVIQLSTSLVYEAGRPTGFQHIARDITEQKALQENMQFYLQQATRAQEEERRRISRELHDDTIQALVVLSRQLDSLATRADGLEEDVRHRLEELWQQTNNIMQGIRRLSQDLRPAALDRLGLLPALEWLSQDVARYSGVRTTLNVEGTQRRFTEEVELVLFRIVQEALRNIWRHSQATAADITVSFGEGKTEVTVTDNGRGFSLPESVGDLAKDGKLGLAGMQERAKLIGGTLCLRSQPEGGSSVTVEIPF